jgi:acetyltransferase
MHGEEVSLPNGRRVLIRRVTPADSPLLAEAFARLSDESRRLRFLTPKVELTDAELRYLTEVDGHHHEALAAIDPRTDQGIGVARFFRDPRDPLRAEFAVTVVDEWQRQGVATVLLTRLSERARQEGIQRFSALVAQDNRTMRALLKRVGEDVRVVDSGPGATEYEIALAPTGLGPQLRDALRGAAAGRLRIPPALAQALRTLVPIHLPTRRPGD